MAFADPNMRNRFIISIQGERNVPNSEIFASDPTKFILIFTFEMCLWEMHYKTTNVEFLLLSLY